MPIRHNELHPDVSQARRGMDFDFYHDDLPEFFFQGGSGSGEVRANWDAFLEQNGEIISHKIRETAEAIIATGVDPTTVPKFIQIINDLRDSHQRVREYEDRSRRR